MSIQIRAETADDIQAIHDLTAAAFLDAPHTAHTEHFIVDALRNAGVLTISLIAECGDKLIGHVALSPVCISDAADHWYGLGPISVLPSEQGHGVGSQLMYAAIAALEKIGAHGCVLLGDPAFYKRFGFEPIAGLTLDGFPAEYFQALRLQGDMPRGRVSYHEAFSAQA